jgi:hypothetical protein
MMNRAKKRSLAVTACLLVATCIAGLSATNAFAEGNWLVEGKEPPTTIEVEASNDSEVFAFLVPKLNFQLVFNKITYDKGALLKGGESSETILFTEGTAYLISPKTLLKNCTPGDLKFELKGSLFLHGGKTYERLVAAKEGDPLTVTTYGEECALGATNDVTGTLLWEDPSGGFGTEATSHLIRQASAELFPTLQMKFGVNAMNLDGSALLKLKGKEAGKKWSGTI